MKGEEKPLAEGHDVDSVEKAVSIPIQEVFSTPFFPCCVFICLFCSWHLFFFSFLFKILFSEIKPIYVCTFLPLPVVHVNPLIESLFFFRALESAFEDFR